MSKQFKDYVKLRKFVEKLTKFVYKITFELFGAQSGESKHAN